MADTAVEMVVSKLKEIQVYHTKLINDSRRQVKDMEENMVVLSEFLKGAPVNMRRMSPDIQGLVQNIHDVAENVEDNIDSFVSQTKHTKTKIYNFMKTKFISSASSSSSSSIDFQAIAKQVEEVRLKVEEFLIHNIPPFTHADQSAQPHCQAPLESSENVIFFEGEMSAAITYLTEETEKLDVITLVGMPGIGKKTLAENIFNDPKIKTQFPIRLWVDLSNNFTRKNVFLTISKKLSVNGDDKYITEKRDERELQEWVLSQLEGKKFLIVLNDVWSTSDWDRLALFGGADEDKITSGKVLITTCSEKLGQYVKRYREPHTLRPLTASKSWELLQIEVFGDAGKCPPQLEMHGKLIASECNGLPLSIVAMGVILVEYKTLPIEEMKTAWDEASRNVQQYCNKSFFDNMPCDLQVCFLYLAAFPYDSEIRVGHLVCLWIAEGFIVESYDATLTLEEKAETYLEALIDRNLLTVSQFKDNGRPKTCRIHRMLHDFCKTEAGHEMENVVTEIKFVGGVFEPPISQLSNCRRFSIHSNVSDFLSSNPLGPRTRSLLSFSKDDVSLTEKHHSSIPEAFKLLRILDFKPAKFTKAPSEIYLLFHLRYLTLSVDIRILPTAVTKLWNIQTLAVDTTYPVLEVKANILELTKLRHFRTNASANLRKPDKSSERGESLQSLGTISPESCTKELFSRTSKLKKLRIRGKLSVLMDGDESVAFENLAELGCLDYLKLVNDVHPLPPSEAPLLRLPPQDTFPPTLKTLTLAATFLEWSQMSILGLLKKLEVLKLKEKAFVGIVWETADGGFTNLKALHIHRTDLVVWVASESHFPRLERLKLRHCEKLQEVPIALADITSLRVLDLYETKLAAASARRFEEKRQSMAAPKFNLSMYPKPSDK